MDQNQVQKENSDKSLKSDDNNAINDTIEPEKSNHDNKQSTTIEDLKTKQQQVMEQAGNCEEIMKMLKQQAVDEGLSPEQYTDLLLERQLTKMQKEFDGKHPVKLQINVYEMSNKLKWTKYLGIGIYHTSLEIFDKIEVAYGGCPSNNTMKGTGIYIDLTQRDKGMKRVKQIPVKGCKHDLQTICVIISNMKELWLASLYDLIHCNCNDFTNALLQTLTKKQQLPYLINNAARTAKNLKKIGAVFKKKDEKLIMYQKEVNEYMEKQVQKANTNIQMRVDQVNLNQDVSQQNNSQND